MRPSASRSGDGERLGDAVASSLGLNLASRASRGLLAVLTEGLKVGSWMVYLQSST